MRQITPLPEKEELEITDLAQLISSSAFDWSTKQIKHWRTWRGEAAKNKRLWDNQKRPFFPLGLSLAISEAFWNAVSKKLSLWTILPASQQHYLLSGLFVISRSAAGFVLQPDHPWLQMSPWQEYTSSQEREAATRIKTKPTCWLSCLLLLLFTHHFSEPATHIRGQQTKQPWSLPEGPTSVLFLWCQRCRCFLFLFNLLSSKKCFSIGFCLKEKK